MKTSHNLPYQLRPNKAVERLIFVDLLNRLDKELNLSTEYHYYGFGGPQMEDFRSIHEIFPLMRMTSIERNEHVQKRQKFNAPHTNIKYLKQTSHEFIEEVKFKRKAIVWLDYTSPSERISQISDFQNLLRKVQDKSIIKITLNANPATLGENKSEQRLERFLKDFGRCFPNSLPIESIFTKHFPSTLLQVIEFTAAESLQGQPDFRFQPLVSSFYADGQIMLTLTGLIGTSEFINKLIRNKLLTNWQYFRPGWNSPVKIDVPELTLKERIYINQLLPKYENKIDRIHQRIGFIINDTKEKSEESLKMYTTFHMHFPHFNKIIF